LENAVKYSPQNSLIEVSAELEGQNACLEVADRGVGIPEDDLAKIFDKFYRVQRPESVSGTGLGLAISKGILEVHHGSIDAHARAGGGTLIHVDLPLYSPVETSNE
jgi:two-component system sensor histidine kinase KdpD